MKAVGYRKSLPVDHDESLLDIELPKPDAAGQDLLVAVKAVSVNPVDAKVRKRQGPESSEFKVLGYDASGVVQAVGSECSLFKVGDEVYYAGSITRSGTNAEFHLVDERIVGKKPQKLSFAQAAAMPLTCITAWELLFDRFSVPKVESKKTAGSGNNFDGTILIIGGAGGVGSILIQLVSKLTNLKIVTTASRPETRQWCLDLGADYVIDHSHSLVDEYSKLKIGDADYIASLTGTASHYPAVVEILAPQGKFGVIDDPGTMDAMPLKSKCASLHWEFMFARSMYTTRDIRAQHDLLNEISDLVDSGVVKTTLDETFGTINATNLKKAHALVESGKSKGKIVLEGF